MNNFQRRKTLRKTILIALVLILATSGLAFSQAGTGSLRGNVKDASGAVLPGVTVTVSSDAIMADQVALSDGSGYYRVLNLPPGTYAVLAELSGFASYRQEGIVLRAGSNFNVDVTMGIGGVEETITVTADTPMLEIASPSNILNVDGEFQREMPIQARRNWSDFLELTPGVNARPFDDGSGRMVYFGHATEHFAHVIQIEGMSAVGYDDAQVTYVGMGADMVEDVSVKTGGITADEPMGTGIVMNVVTKSGGNNFSGSAALAWQNLDWNGDNSVELEGTAGTPTTSQIRQFDGAIGGPIAQDKAWFFFSYRRADLAAGISRTGVNTTRLDRYSGIALGGSADTPARGTVPVYEVFPNTSKSHQPYFKITSQLNSNHQLSAFYQRDTLDNTSDREYNWSNYLTVKTGGNLIGGKLTSVFGTDTTAQFTLGFNDKAGETLVAAQPNIGDIGLEIEIFDSFTRSGGELDGDARQVAGGMPQTTADPSSILLIRADITHFKEGWGGNHEFKTGLFLAPRNRRESVTSYNANADGWYYEGHVPIDSTNLALGTRPFERVRRDVSSVQTRGAADRDIGLYFTDSWKPTQRLTLNLGVRLDLVTRHDTLDDFDRMNTAVVGPRVGFSYMLTEDARNILRGSWGLIHEQVNGRDNVTSYTGSGGGRTDLIREWDEDGDGIFELSDFDPRSSTRIDPSIDFDPDLTQPYVNEAIIGYRTQLPGQLAIDTAIVSRRYTKNYALTDTNGMYPSGPGQPFGGFGLIDPNRGIINQQTNNAWSKLNYTALEITATKQTQRFSFMAGINRQWQHFSGDWNPTDPARFIQPETFDSDRALYMPRGNNEHNTLRASTALSYNPTWRRYSIRFGTTYRAPKDITLAFSFTSNAGPWSGALLDNPGNDPIYGPERVPLDNGTTQENPLATVYRLVGENRGSGCPSTDLPANGVSCDGQARAPAINTLGLKVGKIFSFGDNQEFEIGANIFNLLNSSDHHQFTYGGANRVWSSNYAQLRSLQAARGFQLTLLFRF